MEEVYKELTSQIVADNPDTAQLCLTTLLKFANNLKSDPTEAKFRKINAENAIFKERVYGHAAARILLEMAGWELVDGFLLLPEGDMNTLLPILELQIQQLAPAVVKPAASSAVAAPQKDANTQREIALENERQKIVRQLDREKAEKQRIKAQIEADRENVRQRKLKASVANDVPFGNRMTTFKDIGVDLSGDKKWG